MGKKSRFPGKGNVLLVEPDPILRATVAEQLSIGGYRVFEASDGHQAFILSESLPWPIHLLLTDSELDGKPNGVVLASQLSVLNPHLKIMYLSIYPAEPAARKRLQVEFSTYLSKPLDSGLVLPKVEAVLGGSRPRRPYSADWASSVRA